MPREVIISAPTASAAVAAWEKNRCNASSPATTVNKSGAESFAQTADAGSSPLTFLEQLNSAGKDVFPESAGSLSSTEGGGGASSFLAQLNGAGKDIFAADDQNSDAVQQPQEGDDIYSRFVKSQAQKCDALTAVAEAAATVEAKVDTQQMSGTQQLFLDQVESNL